MRRGFRKPHLLYSLKAEAGYLFPTAYGSLLRDAITVFHTRLAPRDLQTSLREVGRTAAKTYLDQAKGKTPDERIEFALSVLKALGGDVALKRSDGRRLIQGSGCALSAITGSSFRGLPHSRSAS